MRNRFSPIMTLCAAALTVGAALPAAADDTEIYIGQPTGTSAASRPNILFVMDTSGSMGTEVTTQTTYDPKTAYDGKCAADTIYWKSASANFRGRPVDSDCNFRDSDGTTGGAVTQAAFLCKTGQNVIDVNGFQTVNRAAQWLKNSTASKSKWTTLNRSRTTAQVDCADDFDKTLMNPPHGDGTKAYAANGTNGPLQ